MLTVKKDKYQKMIFVLKHLRRSVRINYNLILYSSSFLRFFEIINPPVKADKIARPIDTTDCSSLVFGNFPDSDLLEETATATCPC